MVNFFDYISGKEEFCLDRMAGVKLVVGIALLLLFYKALPAMDGHEWYVPAIAASATWGLLFYGIPLAYEKFMKKKTAPMMTAEL